MVIDITERGPGGSSAVSLHTYYHFWCPMLPTQLGGLNLAVTVLSHVLDSRLWQLFLVMVAKRKNAFEISAPNEGSQWYKLICSLLQWSTVFFLNLAAALLSLSLLLLSISLGLALSVLAFVCCWVFFSFLLSIGNAVQPRFCVLVGGRIVMKNFACMDARCVCISSSNDVRSY